MVDHNVLFDKVVAEAVKRYLELNPNLGTSLGLHEYDSLVTRLDKRYFENVEKFLDEVIEELREVDIEKLDTLRKIDYRVLMNSLKLYKRELREWPTFKMMPSGIFAVREYFTPLLTRTHLPREHVLYAIESRLTRVEDVVLASFEVVEEPY